MFAGIDWLDVLERMIWTALQTAIPVLVGNGVLNLGVEALEVAALSGGASALVVLKELAARRLTVLTPSRNAATKGAGSDTGAV